MFLQANFIGRPFLCKAREKVFLFLKIDFSLFYNRADYKIYFGVNKKNFSIIKKIEKL